MTELEAAVSIKRKALLEYKEKLLSDIKCCEKRLEQVRLGQSRADVFEDEGESSDSDTCLPACVRTGPTSTQLEAARASLSVCLQATQELTSLDVLQSEVNVVVDTPELGPKVIPPVGGKWREVAAECRVDLVPFSMTFFVHQPDGKFSAPSYHNLRVTAVKKPHDLELAQSVLGEVRTPSDAVQVIRSYATAHRSRRTTLARLADRFADTLFMETMPNGGYLLKCADVLSISWTLQNKWSHIAAFHHRMKFELEYMEEHYLKDIRRSHSKLIDPTLGTDERTQLLSKIIDSCLEATRAATETDTDTEGRGRRTTLEAEPEVPPRSAGERLPEVGVGAKKRKKDSEVMAPPKQLPKKGKPKGKEKERTVEEHTVNRKGKDDVGNVETGKPKGVSGQRIKNSAKGSQRDSVKSKEDLQRVKGNGVDEGGNENDQAVNNKVVTGQKSNEKAVVVQKNKESAQKTKDGAGHKDKQSAATVEKAKEAPKNKQNDKEMKVNTQKVVKKASNLVANAKKFLKTPLEKEDGRNSNVDDAKAVESTENAKEEVNKKMKTDNVKRPANRLLENVDERQINETYVKAKENTKGFKSVTAKEATVNAIKEVTKKAETESTKKPVKRPLEINIKAKEGTKNKNTDVVSKKAKITEARSEGNTKKPKKSDNVADLDPKNNSDKKQNEKPNRTEQIDKNEIKALPDTKNKTVAKKSESTKEPAQVEKKISGNVASETAPAKTTKLTRNPKENDKNAQNIQLKTQTLNKDKNPDRTGSSKASEKCTKIPLKTAQTKPMAKLSVPGIRPTLQSGKEAPRILSQNFKKGSKIPKKNFSPISESHARRFENPLRISPRKTPSAMKPGTAIAEPKRMQAAIRNSPRLLKKPTVKPKSMFAF